MVFWAMQRLNIQLPNIKASLIQIFFQNKTDSLICKIGNRRPENPWVSHLCIVLHLAVIFKSTSLPLGRFVTKKHFVFLNPDLSITPQCKLSKIILNSLSNIKNKIKFPILFLSSSNSPYFSNMNSFAKL